MAEPHRIIFVHDWLTTLGGTEKILAALLELWPEAPVHTLVYDPEGPCQEIFAGKEIHTSFIQKLPGAKRNHRRYLPLMPLAVEQFDTSDYDILISTSHAVAHGVLPKADQLHINYICIPIRYAWHLYHDYIHGAQLTRGVRGWIAKLTLHYLRLWDYSAANRVDTFVAISNWARKNVWRAYRRPAEVIYPPVDVDVFTPHSEKEDFYLTVTRLVPYKRIDLMLEAFRQMPHKKLLVIGDGPDKARLQVSAPGNVIFLGFQPFEELKHHLERAKALVYTAVEDFGIVPVEAQACGTPVIAYGKGGVLETVTNGETGILYQEQKPESLVKAVQSFEAGNYKFDIQTLRSNAERFSKERFQKEFALFVEHKWESFGDSIRMHE